MSLRDNQAISRQNSACVIVAPRQLSPRRDRQNGYPSCRCLPIQIVALQHRSRPIDERLWQGAAHGVDLRFGVLAVVRNEENAHLLVLA